MKKYVWYGTFEGTLFHPSLEELSRIAVHEQILIIRVERNKLRSNDLD